MNSDYIVRAEDKAKKMYFVHSGYIEVLSQDGKTPLVYLSKGAYFGEIGVLVTGKRTVSVRSHSNSVIYYIDKVELMKILDEYPRESKFLNAVAQQRLETTPSDEPSEMMEKHITSLI